MYTEKNVFAPKSKIGPFLLVLALVFGLILVGSVCSAVAAITRLAVINITPYLIAAVIAWRVFVTRIREYCYTLTGSTLKIETVSSRRRSSVAVMVNVRAFTAFKPFEGESPVKRLALPSAAGKYYFSYISEGKTVGVMFAPSQTLIDKIQQVREAAEGEPAQ